MRKFLTALVAIAAFALISGCGASGGSDSSANTAAPTTTAAAKPTTSTTEARSAVAVAAWADDFCGNFTTWLDEIKAASADIKDQVTPGDIGSAQQALVTLFGNASAATQKLINSLDQGGSPDVDKGDQLVADLVSKFEAFDKAALTAQSDAKALTSTDVTTFQSDADELTSRFQAEVTKVGDSFGEIDTKYPSSELNAALNSSCG